MLDSAASISDLASLRTLCQGEPPLTARLEPWMEAACLQRDLPSDGSPVNLHNTGPFVRNVRGIEAVAERHGVDLGVFFARKANKALAYVDAAGELGIGVDTASEPELAQTLARGLPADRVIVTAAIKTRSLMQTAAEAGCVVSIDNRDELELLAHVADSLGRTVPAMLRLSGFPFEGCKLPSRFGVDVDDAADFVAERWPASVDLQGVHFHLDGYSAAQRAASVPVALELIDRFRTAGHPVAFLDIGGGFPISYLDNAGEWAAFQTAVADRPDEITWDGTRYDRDGNWSTYPYHQSPTREDWLDSLLAEIGPGLRSRSLQLRCEPGRSMLDGCGMTVADVVSRKQLAGGDWAIGLEMNRTQCRTTSEDFLVDPILLPGSGERTPAGHGYVVGAYCMESEYLTKRRLHFAGGVGLADRVVFPNTAGYLMHFLESRSHQFPLAKNFVQTGDGWMLDAIDSVP